MLRTKGYMMKKVWENGELREDLEMKEEGDDEGIRLVIRDKDVVEDVEIPRNDVIRAMFTEKPSSHSLEERLLKLIESAENRKTRRKQSQLRRSHRKRTVVDRKRNAKSKTKSKKVRRKTSNKSVKLVCRRE